MAINTFKNTPSFSTDKIFRAKMKIQRFKFGQSIFLCQIMIRLIKLVNLYNVEQIVISLSYHYQSIGIAPDNPSGNNPQHIQTMLTLTLNRLHVATMNQQHNNGQRESDPNRKDKLVLR
jgi:hypothetical protein